MIIDTHLHIDRPVGAAAIPGWPACRRSTATSSMRNMRARRKRVGIDATLHMEVDVAADDIEARDRLCRQAVAAAGQPDRRRHRRLPAGRRRASPPFSNGSSRTRRQGLSPRAARHAGRAFGRRAVPRKPEAAGRHRPDLRSRRAAAPDPARRSRSPTWRRTCSSSSTIAACPTSRAAPSIPGAST